MPGRRPHSRAARSRKPPRSGSRRPRSTSRVVADVDNPFAPGLFKGAVDGVKAGAAFLNSKAGGRRTGGSQGRRRLLRLEAQRRTRRATPPSRAARTTRAGGHVGAVPDPGRRTSSTARTRPGRPAGIPDMSAVTTGVPESCSPMSFPAYGTAIDCPTVTQNPQSFFGNQGPAKWELSQEQGRPARCDHRGERHQGRGPRRHDPRPDRAASGDQGRPGRPRGLRVGT